jgi:hypothetical protein
LPAPFQVHHTWNRPTSTGAGGSDPLGLGWRGRPRRGPWTKLRRIRMESIRGIVSDHCPGPHPRRVYAKSADLGPRGDVARRDGSVSVVQRGDLPVAERQPAVRDRLGRIATR